MRIPSQPRVLARTEEGRRRRTRHWKCRSQQRKPTGVGGGWPPPGRSCTESGGGGAGAGGERCPLRLAVVPIAGDRCAFAPRRVDRPARGIETLGRMHVEAV